MGERSSSPTVCSSSRLRTPTPPSTPPLTPRSQDTRHPCSGSTLGEVVSSLPSSATGNYKPHQAALRGWCNPHGRLLRGPAGWAAPDSESGRRGGGQWACPEPASLQRQPRPAAHWRARWGAASALPSFFSFFASGGAGAGRRHRSRSDARSLARSLALLQTGDLLCFSQGAGAGEMRGWGARGGVGSFLLSHPPPPRFNPLL